MRGFDIGSILPEKVVTKPSFGCGGFRSMTGRRMLPQQSSAGNGVTVFR
jgi:hypothetical protein